MLILGLENWRDLIHQYVKEDMELLERLLQYLIEDRVISYDMDEAIYWARRMNVPEEKLPYAVLHSLGILEETPANDEDECWDDEDFPPIQTKRESPTKSVSNASWSEASGGWTTNGDESFSNGFNEMLIKENEEFYKLPLEKSQIIFVDTRNEFTDFLSEIKNEVSEAYFNKKCNKFKLRVVKF